jgi:hippurate hydrolase
LKLLTQFALLLLAYTANAQSASTSAPSLQSEVSAIYPEVQALYKDLHQHPELSGHEVNTAAKLASQLRQFGYEVTEHVGGTGVVGILRKGAGPTVMLRTELAALPVEEKTGLPYASKVTTTDDMGETVSVMHACGHDVHMAALVGTAEIMAKTRDQWQGTLLLIGQPAEEAIGGAKAMLADGLFTRFPKPEYGVALHTSNELPAGKVGFTPGYSLTSADSVNITIYGKGGHGASPQTTVDPIVIAARLVLALQTIVSRETKTGDVAVVTVGYIQGGNRPNIIPDEVRLALSVLSYTPEVRKHLLSAIERMAKAEAEAAGAPKPPLVQDVEAVDAVYNDPKLNQRLSQVLVQSLGADNVEQLPPHMASEDYSQFIEAGVPSFYFLLGVADPEKFRQARVGGISLPSNHSPFFAPDMASLKTAIAAEVALLQNLLAKVAPGTGASL